MVVKIGHAHSDENRRSNGGKAGDQTGGEVLIQDWYLREQGWSVVFRAKDTIIAEKIAQTMERACINNNIGYDQGQRTTLFENASKLNWDVSKVLEKCECDCSSLVAVCVNAAGISVSKNMYTGNQKAVLEATRKFKMLTNTEYLTKPDYLKRGDILLGPGHTAVVVSVGNNIDKAKSFSSIYNSIFVVNTANLNVRAGAGIHKNIFVTIPKGTRVKCYGYYTKILDTVWLYVQFTYKGTKYTGFVSKKYLAKAA